MEEEVKNQDELESHVGEETVDVEPTDEELSAAFDELTNDMAPRSADTPKVDEVRDDPEPEEKLDGETEEERKARHSEESRLGRKVAKISERLDNVATKSELLEIMNRLDDLRKERHDTPPKSEAEEIEEGWGNQGDELDLTTPEGLRTFNRQEREREAKQAKDNEIKYTKGYIETMNDLMSEVDDPNVVKVIKSEMLKPKGECNQVYYGVPERDCAKNFAKALKIAQKKPSTTFDKDGRVPKVATGVTGSSAGSKGSDVLKHELDEYSKALVKDGKLTIAEINEALDGEAPMNLRGKR